MPSMLVVGSVAFDTLHIHQKTYPRILGGSATYAAVAGSIFTSVQLVGVVGRDFPDAAMRLLKQRGVDVTGVEVVDGDTFHWEGRYADDLNSRTTLRTDLNVFADFSPKIPDSFRKTPFIMLGNIDPVLQMEVLDQVAAPQLVVADTMNFWIEGKRADLDRVLKRVDVLVVNDEEARLLAGETNLVRAGRAMQGMGPATVIIKKGEHGALLFGTDEIFCAPGIPLEHVADPTGAGDCFAGGLLGYITHVGRTDDETLRRAVIYGSAAASLCCEGIGPNHLVDITEEVVRARFQHFGRLVHFTGDDWR